MMIYKNTISVDYNYWLNTQLNEPYNQNILNFLKFLSQLIRKRYHKTLGNKRPSVRVPCFVNYLRKFNFTLCLL